MLEEFTATAIDFDKHGNEGSGEGNAGWVEFATQEIIAAFRRPGGPRGREGIVRPDPARSTDTATRPDEGDDPVDSIRYPSLSAVRAAGHLELLKAFQRPEVPPPTVVEGRAGPSDEAP